MGTMEDAVHFLAFNFREYLGDPNIGAYCAKA